MRQALHRNAEASASMAKHANLTDSVGNTFTALDEEDRVGSQTIVVINERKDFLSRALLTRHQSLYAADHSQTQTHNMHRWYRAQSRRETIPQAPSQM
jgi:hypothetical protein